MKHIEISQFSRNTVDPVRYPVLPGRDAQALLAQELDGYWDQGAVVSPVHGEVDSFVVVRQHTPPWVNPGLRIRIIENGLPIIADDDLETDEVSR